ncbi:MAG: hypothetical protein IKY63_01615, partial [Tidjanibacter sp.]|nr:hypothetical protein [Tidjanibacter sp.]
MNSEFLKDKRVRTRQVENPTQREPEYVEARDLNWEERTRPAKSAPRRDGRPQREERPRREPAAGEENIVYGLRPVIEAIETDKQIEKLYVRKGAEGQLMADLKDLCYRSRIRYQE